MSSPTLQSLVDRGAAVSFKCTQCMHCSSWSAASLADLFGPTTTLADLGRGLRCTGDYRNKFTCRQRGRAWIIAPNTALGPYGERTIDDIYGVVYPPYSKALALARLDYPPNRHKKSAPGLSQGRDA